jgi:hypothetical protein
MKNLFPALSVVLASLVCNVTMATSIVTQKAPANQVLTPAIAPTLALNRAKPARAPAPPLETVISYVNLPQALHYLDGRGDAVQGLKAQAKMNQPVPLAKRVSEPASEVLLLAALSALAIAVRRQSPS